ncbi:hypothetical protein M0R89_04490 [Halorussus limi]|uniref:Uncharacterized protein n=1 Tax=Halorussus limi TaxID=2938695 RepID=A0A8U0HWM7_9EURY|nr:hypothetical protein [Halorussus limi]UPV75327.1 hypothetical protein M0R89_04490 [Halorussus limi]
MNRFALALAALLVVAGCSAPTTQGPTPNDRALETRTPTSGPNALPVNESRIFDRVTGLMETDAARPSLRTVPATEVGVDYVGQLDPSYRLLLGAEGSENRTPQAYYDREANRVTVVLHDGVPAGETTETGLAVVLAHEYGHAVQFSDPSLRESLTGPSDHSTDGRRTYRALVEGGAVFVADEYADRYRPSADATGEMAREYRNESATGRFVRGPYWFGGRYFDRRLDSPANLSRVYRTPPNTTEQVIHGYAPRAEPPARLRVSVEKSDDFGVGNEDTAGELFVRDLLGARLTESRAAAAAAGWGNDRLVTLWNYDANESGQRNFVWALRWDDERNATQFSRAFADYADARGERLGDRRWRMADEQFRLVRASDRSVVLVVGAPETVRKVRATADGGNVSVSVASE